MAGGFQEPRGDGITEGEVGYRSNRSCFLVKWWVENVGYFQTRHWQTSRSSRTFLWASLWNGVQRAPNAFGQQRCFLMLFFLRVLCCKKSFNFYFHPYQMNFFKVAVRFEHWRWQIFRHTVDKAIIFSILLHVIPRLFEAFVPEISLDSRYFISAFALILDCVFLSGLVFFMRTCQMESRYIFLANWSLKYVAHKADRCKRKVLKGTFYYRLLPHPLLAWLSS